MTHALIEWPMGGHTLGASTPMRTKTPPKKSSVKSGSGKGGAMKSAGRATTKVAKSGGVAASGKSAPRTAGKASTTKRAPAGSMLTHETAHLFKAGEITSERPYIYVNGKMVPKSQAMVSVYDHGLLYGDGVFEGIRIYNGKIFKCGQHMERLWRCAEMIRLRIPVSRDEMVQIMRDCIKANGIVDGYIRLVVTRGYGTLGLDPRKCPVAGVICIADQIALYSPEQYEKGMRIIVAKRPRTPIECLDPRVKSLNYLNNILGKVEAIDQGCDEAIMLNLDGFVGECTGDNIFIIRDGKVYTPPTESGILEGITRNCVIQLARQAGYEVRETTLVRHDIYVADECFLTGTAAEVIPATSLDGRLIGTGKPGPVTRDLLERFRKLTRGG